MKSVLFVAAEGLPYIKTGGLADVIGSLPKILNEKGMDARVVLPLYKRIAEKYRGEFTKLKTIPIHVGVIDTVATIYQSQWENVTYYFIEHAGYFERDGLYGYPDDGERFAFYQKAVLEMLWAIDFFPDIMHCHDWHTGMIAAMCHIQYPDDQRYQQIKHMYTIHNLAFQGNFPADVLTDCLGIDRRYFDDGSMRFHNGISFMKTGIIFSDKITTVSPSYSQEILTAQYGEQMDEVLRFRQSDLYGIVNGIDTKMWDPMTDPALPAHYNAETVLEGKRANKAAVQKELGLRVADDVMMIGIVSRLTWQKGVYLIIEKMADIMGLDVQFVDVYKRQELHDDLGCTIPHHGYLMKWAQQGVFLMNTVLTVEDSKPLSHRGKGWEEFTDEVMRKLNDHPDPLVFILWGRNACLLYTSRCV